MTETREEFEKRYLEAYPRTVFGKTHVSMECHCDGVDYVPHWACVEDTPGSVQYHLDHEKVLAWNREHSEG